MNTQTRRGVPQGYLRVTDSLTGPLHISKLREEKLNAGATISVWRIKAQPGVKPHYHLSVSFPMPISNPWSWYADCGMQDCQTGERGRGFNTLRRDSTPSCESDNVVFFIYLFWWLILRHMRYVRVHSTHRHL